jgi:nucleoside-triphosphatase
MERIEERAGGFFTREIRERGQRVGFKVQDIRGAEGVMAHINHPGPHRVSRYGVDVQTLEAIALPALEWAMRESDWVVMDELGRMELYSRPFQEMVLRVLDSTKRVLGVIQQADNSFLNAIRQRQDIQVFIVTPENRNHLLPVLEKAIKGKTIPPKRL